MLWTPLNVMQGIYIKYYGFSIGLLAAILLASRLYDAVADIAIGSLSDWSKAKTGRRKPLFALGAALFAVCALFVYIPPKSVGPFYLTFWLFAFFTAYAMTTIPHLAWGAELAASSVERTRILSMRCAASYSGLCLFYAIPLLPLFASSAITPRAIRYAVLLAVAILVPALLACLKFVPEARTLKIAERRQSLFSRRAIRDLGGNRPFRALMSAYLICGLALGIWYGMIFIFVDVYLHRGAWFAPLYLLAFGAGILAALGWHKIAARFGKKTAWTAGMLLTLATVGATGFLTPRNASLWSLGSILVLNTMGFVSFELLPASIVGDVADYTELKMNRNQTATLYALYMFATKVVVALGAALGLALSAALGFDPHLIEQGPTGVNALAVVMSWLPGLLLVAAIMLIPCIPMNERRHAIVRRRLDQLCARQVR